MKNRDLPCSKYLGVETSVYATTKGWYFENTSGFYREDFGDIKKIHNYDCLQSCNAYDQSLPYSLYKGGDGYQNNVRPDINNPRSWSTMYLMAHTHPRNSEPSGTDMTTQRAFGCNVITWGWLGRDGVVDRNNVLWHSISMYFWAKASGSY